MYHRLFSFPTQCRHGFCRSYLVLEPFRLDFLRLRTLMFCIYSLVLHPLESFLINVIYFFVITNIDYWLWVCIFQIGSVLQQILICIFAMSYVPFVTHYEFHCLLSGNQTFICGRKCLSALPNLFAFFPPQKYTINDRIFYKQFFIMALPKL